MIIIKDLTIFDTAQTKLILTISQLEISRGDCCLIGGNSGTGKTVLLKTLANQHQSFAGNILIKERMYESFSDNELVSLIQFLNQGYTLFSHLSAEMQLIQPLVLLRKNTEQEAKEKANFYISSLDLQDHTTKHPHELSGGQRQRFALIQKLLLEPEILLLDEPTSGLDKKSKERVLLLLQQEQKKKNMTILITSHDKDIIESNLITQKFLLS